jgi:hypothetical protein
MYMQPLTNTHSMWHADAGLTQCAQTVNSALWTVLSCCRALHLLLAPHEWMHVTAARDLPHTPSSTPQHHKTPPAPHQVHLKPCGFSSCSRAAISFSAAS